MKGKGLKKLLKNLPLRDPKDLCFLFLDDQEDTVLLRSVLIGKSIILSLFFFVLGLVGLLISRFKVVSIFAFVTSFLFFLEGLACKRLNHCLFNKSLFIFTSLFGSFLLTEFALGEYARMMDLKPEDYKVTSGVLLMCLGRALPLMGLRPKKYLLISVLVSLYTAARIHLAGETNLIFLVFVLMLATGLFEAIFFGKLFLDLQITRQKKKSAKQLEQFYEFVLPLTRNADQLLLLKPKLRSGSKQTVFSKANTERLLDSNESSEPLFDLIRLSDDFLNADYKQIATGLDAKMKEACPVEKNFRSVEIDAPIQLRLQNSNSAPPAELQEKFPKLPKSLTELLNAVIIYSERELSKSMPHLSISAKGSTFDASLNERVQLDIHLVNFKGAPEKTCKKNAWLLFVKDNQQPMELKRLKELDTFKDRLLATIVHDMRSPLNLVLTMVSKFEESHDQNERKSYVRIAVINIKMLLGLVHDLLDYSLFKEKKMRLLYSEFSLKAAIQEAIELIEFQAFHKGVRLLVSNSFDEDIMNTDERRLKQILINLLTNALKFTREGSITVKVTNVIRKHSLLFEVTDTGQGISPDVIGRLGRPFETFDNEKGDNKSGIGLGLCIVRTLIEQLGPSPELTIKSTVGKGSTFSFLAYRNIEFKDKSSIQGHLTQSSPFNSLKTKILDSHEPNSVDRRNSFISLNHKMKPGEKTQLRRIATALGPASSKKIHDFLLDDDLNDKNPFEDPLYYSESGNSPPVIDLQSNHFNDIRTLDPKSRILARLCETQSSKKLGNDLLPQISLLIADDNIFNIFTLEAQLKKINLFEFSISRACNGQEAIEVFVQKNQKDNNPTESSNIPIDLIFMDCLMPIMDGYTAARNIKQLVSSGAYMNCEIIAFTSAVCDLAEKSKCSAANMDFIIEKPAGLEALKSLLRDVFSSSLN